MARKKMVDGKLLEVPSVSGRPSVMSKVSGASKSMRHTAQNEAAEDAIFNQLLNKRKEEQEHTREHFINSSETEYPLISDLVNTWEELCFTIIKQHDFLDQKLMASEMKYETLASDRQVGEAPKEEESKGGLSSKDL
jgi:hypothetical protein